MSFKACDVVAVDFPGVNGIKHRPAIVLTQTHFILTENDDFEVSAIISLP